MSAPFNAVSAWLLVVVGIYLPGIGGVRIEDTVVVRADGCDILTGSTKELVII